LFQPWIGPQAAGVSERPREPNEYTGDDSVCSDYGCWVCCVVVVVEDTTGRGIVVVVSRVVVVVTGGGLAQPANNAVVTSTVPPSIKPKRDFLPIIEDLR
jgi:hypothetical protein